MCHVISVRLQKLKSIIEEREAVALTTLASETKWLLDICGPEFSKAWLSEDIPDTALDIVAQGLPAAPAPISTEISTPLRTTTKFTHSYSVLDAKLQLPAKSTRPLTASQSLNVLQTADSRPQKPLPRQGVCFPARDHFLRSLLHELNVVLWPRLGRWLKERSEVNP